MVYMLLKVRGNNDDGDLMFRSEDGYEGEVQNRSSY